MTERRPHWDDELIEAVGTAIENADPACYPTVGMVSDVIAAVEDWFEDTFIAITSAQSERIEKAETAIQRVWEWCERGHYPPDASRSDWQTGFLTARGEVREILDGAS